MVKRSETDQGYIVTCDHCGLSTVSAKETFPEVVKQITMAGGEVRQEAHRTGSGYSSPSWRNYCSKCTHIEGIFL